MKKIMSYLSKSLHAVMVIALSLMVILVFTNVVLRYLFESGIIWSVEISRYIFVWLTFLGAIAAFKDNEHLGVDALVRRLPGKLKKLVAIIGYGLMLFLIGLLFDGSWKMTVLSLTTKSPATGLPLSVIYAAGLTMSTCIGLMIIFKLYLITFNKINQEDLIIINDSEEMISFEKNDSGKGVKSS